MPRNANLGREQIIDKAMHFFWEKGFNSASIDALLKDLGTTRFSLYQHFGGKQGLYEVVLDHYSETIVTQAINRLSAKDAPYFVIKGYFEFLIDSAEKNSALARGCLMANTMVEFSQNEQEIKKRFDRHFERITKAIEKALKCSPAMKTEDKRKQQAISLATFAQGLWIRARAGASANSLRLAVDAALSEIR
jgi:TetR/AcrR family transcriptional regulator, transcriptional repressor for nem operon